LQPLRTPLPEVARARQHEPEARDDAAILFSPMPGTGHRFAVDRNLRPLWTTDPETTPRRRSRRERVLQPDLRQRCPQRATPLRRASELYRRRAFAAYGPICIVPGCGYDNRTILEVHHRDGNRQNNRIENLDVLCPTHHAEFVAGIRRYE